MLTGVKSRTLRGPNAEKRHADGMPPSIFTGRGPPPTNKRRTSNVCTQGCCSCPTRVGLVRWVAKSSFLRRQVQAQAHNPKPKPVVVRPSLAPFVGKGSCALCSLSFAWQQALIVPNRIGHRVVTRRLLRSPRKLAASIARAVPAAANYLPPCRRALGWHV